MEGLRLLSSDRSSVFAPRSCEKIAPTWGEIESALTNADAKNGAVTLERIDGDGKIKRLQVLMEGRKYLLTFGKETRDDYEILEYGDGAGPSGMVEMHGELWDKRLVCDDVNVVVRLFKQLFNDGDINPGVLN